MDRAKWPQVVVITGASAGVGRAVTRRFARDGAHIGLIARRHDGLEAAASAAAWAGRRIATREPLAIGTMAPDGA